MPQPLQIPEAQPPILTRMISNAMFPKIVDDELTGKKVRREDPLAWLIGQPHPLVPKKIIIRMFLVRGVGVEIYSASEDMLEGIRDLIPMAHIRLIGEEMPLDIFVEELTLSEAGADADEDDDSDSDPEPGPELDETPEPANNRAEPS